MKSHLKAQETRHAPEERKARKLALTRRLYERGYEREDILNLFQFIDWLLALPEELEQEFRQDIEQYEAENAMPYITSVERFGIHQGIERDRREIVSGLLKTRFGELDAELEAVVEVSLTWGLDEVAERMALLLDLSREELVAQFGAESGGEG